MRKTAIFILLCFLVACSANNTICFDENNYRQYSFDTENGEPVEDLTVYLDESERFVTRIEMTIWIKRELLEKLSGSSEDQLLFDSFSKLNGILGEHLVFMEVHSHNDDEHPPIIVIANGQMTGIIVNEYRIDINLCDNESVRNSRSLLEGLGFSTIDKRTGLLRFEPAIWKKESGTSVSILMD